MHDKGVKLDVYPLIFASLHELVSLNSRDFAESSGSLTEMLISALELFSNAMALFFTIDLGTRGVYTGYCLHK